MDAATGAKPGGQRKVRCSCLDSGQEQEARLGFREDVDGGVPGSPKRLFWKRAARAADSREQSGWRLRVMSPPSGRCLGAQPVCGCRACLRMTQNRQQERPTPMGER